MQRYSFKLEDNFSGSNELSSEPTRAKGIVHISYKINYKF